MADILSEVTWQVALGAKVNPKGHKGLDLLRHFTHLFSWLPNSHKLHNRPKPIPIPQWAIYTLYSAYTLCRSSSSNLTSPVLGRNRENVRIDRSAASEGRGGEEGERKGGTTPTPSIVSRSEHCNTDMGNIQSPSVPHRVQCHSNMEVESLVNSYKALLKPMKELNDENAIPQYETET